MVLQQKNLLLPQQLKEDLIIQEDLLVMLLKVLQVKEEVQVVEVEKVHLKLKKQKQILVV
jgi:hypothetical protein